MFNTSEISQMKDILSQINAKLAQAKLQCFCCHGDGLSYPIKTRNEFGGKMVCDPCYNRRRRQA